MRGEPIDVGPVADAGFGDEQPVGSEAREALGGGEVDAEVAQVAIVDPDQRRAERERALHLGFVVDLDQRVHAEPPRLRDDLARACRRRAATA